MCVTDVETEAQGGCATSPTRVLEHRGWKGGGDFASPAAAQLPKLGRRPSHDPKGGGAACSSQAWRFRGEREVMVPLPTSLDPNVSGTEIRRIIPSHRLA